MKLIDKNMLIGDLSAYYPHQARILVEKYGFHCLSCPLAGQETIEEGAMGHGMTKKQIKEMLEVLNKSLQSDKLSKK